MTFCDLFSFRRNRMASSRKSLTMITYLLRFLEKKTPYGQIVKNWFQKDSCGCRNTYCIQISWNLAYRKSVKSHVAYLTKQKQNFGMRSCSCFCADRAQNLSGTPPEIFSERPKFHPNPFTSSGIIAGHVNIVQMGHKLIHSTARL